MVEKKDGSQRRVYSLPTELVDRIVQFQNEKGFSSEVEAVRRLLDEALLHRDDKEAIIRRFVSKLQNVKIPSEVAKDVLVGHPLIKEISFDKDTVSFTIKDGWQVKIDAKGHCYERPSEHAQWEDWFPF